MTLAIHIIAAIIFLAMLAAIFVVAGYGARHQDAYERCAKRLRELGEPVPEVFPLLRDAPEPPHADLPIS